MSRILSYHGGNCCGVKHIYGFDYFPDYMMQAQSKGVAEGDIDYSRLAAQMCTQAMPSQTAKERFKEIVAYNKKKRPHGMIEVVLASQRIYDYSQNQPKGASQVNLWRKVVEAEGFVEVSHAKNSNSGNTIHLFILSY